VIHVDYLVVGAGAMGMAFADALLNETGATIAIVDRYGIPGGHWTRAYPNKGR
jgi:cation diffusion facilitator CzcD-associated flavoprotein CzcO